MASRGLIVSGFPEGTTEAELTMYFQSRKKSGGGDIAKIKMEEGRRRAAITFEEEEVAKRVCSRKFHALKDAKLQVSLNSLQAQNVAEGSHSMRDLNQWEPSAPEDLRRSNNAGRDSSTAEEEANTQVDSGTQKEASCRLNVTGLSKETSPDSLLLYFESRRSSGGPVDDVKINPECGTAIVTFKSAEVAKRVAERTDHMQHNRPITVSLLPKEEPEFTEEVKNENPQPAESERCLSFFISNLSSRTTEDTLRYYFENAKRSGGGDIKDLMFFPNEGVAELLFVEVADYERLVGQEHRLEGQTLSVEIQEPEEDLPLDARNLYVEGLNPQTSRDCLRLYLEKFSVGVEVERIQFGAAGNALVTFKEPPDFDYIIDNVNSYDRGLEDSYPLVRRSPVCCSVRVTGLSKQTTDETLTLYFESKKSSGGDVDHVDYQEGSDSAIVYFKDVQSAQSVVKKQGHSLHHVDLTVRLYHSILEDGPQNHERGGRRKRKAKLQKELHLDHDITSFIEEFHQDELENLLQSLEVSMVPNKSADSVVISSCSVGHGDQVQRAWAEKVEAIESFFNTFTKTSIDLDRDVAVEVQKQIDETDLIKEGDKVQITFLDFESSVQFIGRESHVYEVRTCFQNITDSIQEDLRLKKSLTTSVERDIPEEKLRLLDMSGYCLELEKKRKHLKIDVDSANGHIKFSGPEAEIAQAKNGISKFLMPTKSLVLEMPERCLSVLFSAAGRSYTQKSFQEQKIVATVSPGQRSSRNEATILGSNDSNARKAESFLQRTFQEFSSPLKDGQFPVTNGRGWKELVSQVEFQSPVSVSIESNTLWVSGVSSMASRSLQQLKEFLGHNTILKECIPMPRGCSRFLVKVWRDKVENITKKNSATWSVADQEVGKEHEGITISGNAENLTKCIEEIRNLASKIQCDNIDIDKPGMGKQLGKPSGAALLKTVEDKFQCTVEKKDVQQQTSDPLFEERTIDKKDDFCCTCTYVTQMEKRISVYKDDLTKHNVDAIVNAANDRLKHIGGLAGTIVQKGGNEIQEECDAYIRQSGPLLDGQVFSSGPGKLPCKRIIHAVGPRWDKDASSKRVKEEKTRQEKMLSYAITNCLEEASSMSSIAIPALSSGVFGFPLDLCASVIIDAVVKYFDQNPTCRLSEVHLTNNDDSTVTKFTDEMRKNFGTESTFREYKRKPESTKSYPSATPPTPTKRKSITRTKPHLTTPEGVKISVRPGDLTDAKADVLVGSCGSALELNKNPCARALSQAAGPGLQQECSTKGAVKDGDIAKAGPHGLQCKAVYFSVCSPWNNGKGEKVLIDLFNKCLTKAHTSNMGSIAFSSIGTGILGFPSATVAKVYFDQATAFSIKNPHTTLKDIKFIPFDKDTNTVTAFTDELSKRIRGELSLLHDPEKAQKQQASSPVFSTVQERATDQLQLNVGSNICFQVQAGDITKEATDAIVIISNPELDLKRGGGAGAAILRKGGDSIQKECRRMGTKSPGSVAITSAGGLEANFIFHIVPPSTKDGMEEAVVNCLKFADSKNLRSISFPAVGTGNLGMDPKDCAKLLLASVEKFSQQNPQSLQLVRIVIYQPPMVDAFRSVMKMKSGEKSPNEVGIIGRLAQKAASYFPFGSNQKTETSHAQMAQPDYSVKSLEVFAGSRQVVDEAIQAIRQMMDDHCKRSVIENDAISMLSPDHQRCIRAADLRYGTKVKIEKEVGRIEIRGSPGDVLEVSSQIHVILHEIKEDESKRGQGEMLAKSVEWEYNDGEKFEKYSKDINLEIETAYSQQKRQVNIIVNKVEYNINFTTMKEKCLDDGNVVDVRRRDLKDLAVPAHWSTQPTDSNGTKKKVHLVKLTPGTSEYQMVEQLFTRSAQATLAIVSIERVQNPELNGVYETKKAKMDERKGSNEQRLFHGTAAKNLDDINARGFNRSYAGEHAALYGNGVYFAVQASYSARPTYSPQDQKGLRYMYLAKVLVGEYVVGKRGLIVPPSKNDPSNHTESYDTVVDQLPSPEIIVTFYDWQCYPEYLITFQ